MYLVVISNLIEIIDKLHKNSCYCSTPEEVLIKLQPCNNGILIMDDKLSIEQIKYLSLKAKDYGFLTVIFVFFDGIEKFCHIDEIDYLLLQPLSTKTMNAYLNFLKRKLIQKHNLNWDSMDLFINNALENLSNIPNNLIKKNIELDIRLMEMIYKKQVSAYWVIQIIEKTFLLLKEAKSNLVLNFPENFSWSIFSDESRYYVSLVLILLMRNCAIEKNKMEININFEKNEIVFEINEQDLLQKPNACNSALKSLKNNNIINILNNKIFIKQNH